MPAPDYIICLECETPVYIFDWKDGGIAEALCELCGNDEITQFATEDDYDALAMASESLT